MSDLRGDLRGDLRSDGGSVTAWLLVVPLLLLVMGGLSLDLWAALSVRGRVAAIADDAAAAGATAVSVADLRDGGTARVDAGEASARALRAVDTHPDAALVTARTVATGDRLVSVTVDGEVVFTLLRLVGATTAPVRVTGHAAPVVRD
ncbi:hypothetical protein BH23ACT9_BH23ACT9_36390 [soil metagenome]